MAIAFDTLVQILVLCVIPVWIAQVGNLWILRDIKRTSDKLLRMHEDPGSTGFGTVAQDGLLTDIRDAIRELIHYSIADYKQRTGKAPMPPDPTL